MKRLELLLIFLLSMVLGNAQIGYQVSLLNTATGEPRANERVTAKIELSNSDGEAVYSETQTGVTNDFGVLSLTIGNSQSLSAIDWSKYPMFISVTVDNVLIGKTQVMSVPYANAVVPLSMDLVVGTWSGTIIEFVSTDNPYYYNTTIFINSDGICKLSIKYYDKDAVDEIRNYSGFFSIVGNQITCIFSDEGNQILPCILQYINGNLYVVSSTNHWHMTKLTKQQN